MGFRFRKSFGNKFFRVTLSNKGVSTSAGVPGARVSVSSKGRVTGSAGVPGSGVYYTKSRKIVNNGHKKTSPANSSSGGKNPTNYDTLAIILVLVFFPAGLPIMWAKTAWNKIIKIVITAFFAILFVAVAFDTISDTTTMVTALIMAAYCISVPFWAKPKKQNIPEANIQNDTQHAQTTYFENGIKVYINTKTNVCHFSADCPAYQNANPENKRELITHSLNDLLSYDFCSRCSSDE